MTRAQSRTWQKRIIASAQATGELDSLYWFVNRHQRSTEAAAMHPRGYVPLVPVAPDPATSRHWAHLLLELLRRDGMGIELALTNIEALGAVRWYEWGDAFDEVCCRCGGVERAGYSGNGSWICGHCNSTL